jgi:hypothetical protein
MEPSMTDTRRQQRQEIRLLQREATWLQKALFALGKAADARDRMEAGGEDDEPAYVLDTEEGTITMDALEASLEARVKVLMDLVRERRRTLR